MDWWVLEGFVRPIGYAVWVVMVGSMELGGLVWMICGVVGRVCSVQLFASLHDATLMMHVRCDTNEGNT